MYHLQSEKIVKALYSIMKIIDKYILKKTTQYKPLTHPTLTTLCFRVKSIYCYNLLSVREAGGKPTIGYISYSITEKFMKRNLMIYSFKCSFQFNKYSRNKDFIIYCLFNIFNKANYKDVKPFFGIYI